MPFSVKKTYAVDEFCLDWVEVNGHTYTCVTKNSSGGLYTRVYDETGAILISSTSALSFRIFTINSILFLVENNTFKISKWTGASFVMVAYANGYSKTTEIVVYSNNAYLICNHDTGVTKSGLFKFNGANSGGLTTLRTSATRRMMSLDINPATGDIIVADHNGFGIGAGAGKIYKVTQLGVETELVSVPAANTDIYQLKVYDGAIHYVRSVGSDFGMCKLDTFSAGATETVLYSGFAGITSESNGAYFAGVVFDGYFYFKIFNKIFRFVTGVSPALFETYAVAITEAYGNFSLVDDELIAGAPGKFLTTAITCDLALGSPAYNKINETAEDADDGAITVFATSSFYIQYSLDGITYQSSNVFTGLAPGSYDIYLQDTKGCELQILDVVILEFDPVDPPDPVEGDELIIDARPVNSNNFVLWFNAFGDTAFNSTTITNCINGLPKPYRLNKRKGINHYPCIVNGEQFSFYINFDTDYKNPNFTSLRLNVINIYGNVQSAVAQLYQVMAADGVSYFIYASPTLAGLTPGCYRLALVDVDDDGRILFVSQEIKVITTDISKQETIRVQYKNSVNNYRYLYESIPDYINQIRLRINVLEENPEGELTQYRAVSSGKLRNVYVELDLAIKLETYYFDDLAHKAVFTFQVCDYIFFNEKAYLVKGLYKPDWGNPAKTTSKGVLEVYEQDFSTANRYGVKESIVIVGSDDPLLLGDGGYIKL